MARPLTHLPQKPLTARRRALKAAAVTLAGWPGWAVACTLCNSRQAVSIRARLFEGDLWWNAAAVLLPISLLLLLVAAVAREPRGRGEIG